MMNLDLERGYAVVQLVFRQRIPASRPRERVGVIKLMLITLAWRRNGSTGR